MAFCAPGFLIVYLKIVDSAPAFIPSAPSARRSRWKFLRALIDLHVARPASRRLHAAAFEEHKYFLAWDSS